MSNLKQLNENIHARLDPHEIYRNLKADIGTYFKKQSKGTTA